LNGLIKQSAQIVAGKAVSSLFSVFVFAYIVRQIPKSEWAVIATFEMLLGISAIVANYGISNTLTQFYPSAWLEKQEKILKSLNGLSMIAAMGGVLISVCLAIAAPLISGLIFKEMSVQYSGYVRLFPFYFLPNYLVLVCEPYFVATQSFGRLSFLQTSRSIFEKIAAFGLFLKYGLEGYLWGIILSAIIFVVVYGASLRRLIVMELSFETVHLLKYTFPFYLRSLARCATSYADQLLVAILLNVELLALYNVARRIIEYLKIGIGAVADPIMVSMAQARGARVEERMRIFVDSRSLFLHLFFPILIWCLSLSPVIIIVTAGRSYIGAWIYVALLSVALMPNLGLLPYMSALFAYHPPRYITTVEVSTGVVTLLSSVLCVTMFGAYGIAVSQMVGYAVGLVLARSVMMRLDQKKVAPNESFSRVVFSNLVLGVVLSFISYMVATQPAVTVYGAAAILTAGALLFGFVNLAVLPKQTRDLIRVRTLSALKR
jgi:O-antigen/teichoic acid export membrane protein